jgi:uncharacterized membrane protein YgcG
VANYNTEAYGKMRAVVQAKETYEYAQAAGASTEDLLRLTAAASAAREWLNGHGYGWAASALGYSTANAAQAKAWLTTVGLPRLQAEWAAGGGGGGATPGGGSGGGGGGGSAGGPDDTGRPVIVPQPGSGDTSGLPPFNTVVWAVLGIGGLLAIKSLFGR